MHQRWQDSISLAVYGQAALEGLSTRVMEAQEQNLELQGDMQAELDHIACSLKLLVAIHGRQLTEQQVTNDLLFQFLEQGQMPEQLIVGLSVAQWDQLDGSIAGPGNGNHLLSVPWATHASASSFGLPSDGLPLWGLVTSLRGLLHLLTMSSSWCAETFSKLCPGNMVHVL